MGRFGWVVTIGLAVACVHSIAQEPSQQVSRQLPPLTESFLPRAEVADDLMAFDRSIPAETLDVPPSRYVVFMGSAEVATPAMRNLALEIDAIFAAVAAGLGTSPEALLLAVERRRASTAGTTIPDLSEAPRLRVGVRLSTPTRLCPPRGAVSDLGSSPSFVIYVKDRTTIEQLRGVAAHELGHLFSVVLFGASLRGVLGEGFATWAAGRYWTDWQGVSSLTAAVRSYRAAGTFLPLGAPFGAQPERPIIATDSSPEARDAACLARRDVDYTTWAGFVEYLVDEHGLPKMIELMRDPRNTRLPPLDYAAFFGDRRDELELAWLRMVDERAEPPLAER